MPRVRAWRHDELQHAAWLRVLQGRRPPSEQWPQPAASASVWKCSTPPETTQVQDVQRPRRTPEETQVMAPTKVRRIEAAIAALGDDDGEEFATLQSCLRRQIVGSVSSSGEAYRRLFPVHRKGQEESRSVQRRSGNCGETPRGFATRNGKVGCCSINSESIRWPSFEAVSAGGFRAPLRRGSRNGCRGVIEVSKRPLREDISWKWRGFPSSSPLLLRSGRS